MTPAENTKRWRLNYPIGQMLVAARQRAKMKSLDFNLKPSDIEVPDFCPVLGIKLERSLNGKGGDGSPSLDRIDNHLGYVAGNVIVVSNRANRIKSDASVEELQKVVSFYKDLTRG